MEGKDMAEQLGDGLNIITKDKLPTIRSKSPPAFTLLPRPEDRSDIPDASGRTKHDPSKEEARKANAGEYAGNTRVVKKVGGNKALKIFGAVGTIGAGIGAYEAYQNVPAVHRAVDSAFLDHLRGKSSPPDTSIAETVFDNSATKGVITDKNTIQMTREEYQKIAPPVINRENVQEVPVEFATPGRKRNLTFERGTSVNAMIYVKTADGTIRNVTYTKIASPGEVTGAGPIPITFPGCEVFLGQKGEIQATDKFPAPISGRVYYSGSKAPEYYKGQKLEDGTNVGGDYFIEGEYRDPKTGKKFKATVQVHTLEVTTKPFMYIPNDMDDSFKEKVKGVDSDGKEVEVLATNRNRIPIVTVQQGEDFFQFITEPRSQFLMHKNIQSQIVVFSSYHDIGENGRGNTFGGENCTSPTLDNKAIVLK